MLRAVELELLCAALVRDEHDGEVRVAREALVDTERNTLLDLEYDEKRGEYVLTTRIPLTEDRDLESAPI